MADLAEDTDVPEGLAMTVQVGGSTSVCASPDGQYLATGLCNGVLAIIDMDTLSVIRSERAHEGPISALVWCKDGTLVTTGEDGWCSQWQEYGLEVSSLLNIGSPIKQLESADKDLFAAIRLDGNIVIGNFAKSETLVLEPTARAVSLAWSMAGSCHTLLCGNSKGYIDVFSENHLVNSIKISNAAIRQIVTGETLIVVNAGDRKVRATTHPGPPNWDVETLSRFEDAISRTQFSSLALSPRGTHIFAIAEAKVPKGYLWSTIFGTCLKEYPPAPESMRSVAFFYNAPKVVGVGAFSGAIYIWSNKLRDNWSTLLPQFTQMLDVEPYREHEGDFDVYDEDPTQSTIFKAPVDIWSIPQNTEHSSIVRIDL